MDDVWDSGLYEKVIDPIAHEALEKFGDDIRKTVFIKTEIQGYTVELINNDVIHNEMFAFMFPDYADTECQCNIHVKIKDTTYVIIYQYIKGEWIRDLS